MLHCTWRDGEGHGHLATSVIHQMDEFFVTMVTLNQNNLNTIILLSTQDGKL